MPPRRRSTKMRSRPRRRNPRRRMMRNTRRTRRSNFRRVGRYLRPNPFALLKYQYENALITVAPSTTTAAWVFMYPMNPAPLSNSVSGSPGAGDTLYTGLEQYGNYYGMARCFASKIRAHITNSSIEGSCKVALLAVPWRSGGYTFTANAPSILTSSYSQTQLFSYPGTRIIYLGSSTGSDNIKTLSMFRKSKTMLGVKNLKDDEYSSFLMSSSLGHSLWAYPNDVWYYALAFWNNSQTTGNFTLSLELTSAFQFWSPLVIDQQILT